MSSASATDGGEMPVARIQGYHAHVYFDQDSAEAARRLRDRIGERFDVALGRFHERNVGPHPRWSYQVAFGPELFGTLVPWLALNRNGLTVLVHGLSGDHVFDHTALAMWLGESVELDLSALE